MKKTKRNVITAILITIVIVAFGILYVLFSTFKKSDDGFTKSFNEFKVKLENNQSEIHYEDYLSVEKKLIMPPVRFIEQNENSGDLKYRIDWKNKTSTPIELKARIYCEKSFRQKYVIMAEPILHQTDAPLIIDPGRGYSNQHITSLRKPYDEWNDKDKAEIDKLAKVLYIEMCINDKFCYFELPLE